MRGRRGMRRGRRRGRERDGRGRNVLFCEGRGIRAGHGLSLFFLSFYFSFFLFGFLFFHGGVVSKGSKSIRGLQLVDASAISAIFVSQVHRSHLLMFIDDANLFRQENPRMSFFFLLQFRYSLLKALPMTILRISLVPAPISYSLASLIIRPALTSFT